LANVGRFFRSAATHFAPADQARDSSRSRVELSGALQTLSPSTKSFRKVVKEAGQTTLVSLGQFTEEIADGVEARRELFLGGLDADIGKFNKGGASIDWMRSTPHQPFMLECIDGGGHIPWGEAKLIAKLAHFLGATAVQDLEEAKTFIGEPICPDMSHPALKARREDSGRVHHCKSTLVDCSDL
jgi:hypothetical protein